MRLLCLADLHIGSIKDTTYVYNVISDIVDKELLLNKTDMVVVLGDYFDRLFKTNDQFVGLAVNIMSLLVKSCRKYKTAIRLVYGTESHEMQQYQIFNDHFMTSDIRLISTVTEEEFNGCNILYLPEEYIIDKQDFYKDTLYSGKKYDYIFGHGIIEEGMPSAVSFIPGNGEKSVPRFKSTELSEAGKLTVFGHQHKHVEMPGNVYYLGSLFRNSFGQEEPKGYGIIEGDQLTFVENVEAYTYKTYEFSENSDVYKSQEALAEAINKIKEENDELFNGDKTGKIRLIFHTADDATFRDNLRAILTNDKIICPLIKEESHEIIEDAKSVITDEYEFILDKNLPVTDKIWRYINKQTDDVMSLDELINYIEKPLKI